MTYKFHDLIKEEITKSLNYLKKDNQFILAYESSDFNQMAHLLKVQLLTKYVNNPIEIYIAKQYISNLYIKNSNLFNLIIKDNDFNIDDLFNNIDLIFVRSYIYILEEDFAKSNFLKNEIFKNL